MLHLDIACTDLQGKRLCCVVDIHVFDWADALDLPSKPLALVVRLALRRQAVYLRIHGGSVRTILAHHLCGHHHAVPLAGLLQLR